MERLSPLDAAFLEIEDEDRNSSLAIASLAVVEGPAPGQEDFVAAVVARLPGIPRYHQKIRQVPFDLGPPGWVDDPAFDPADHIGRIALPAPHDENALCELVALLMNERLERDRPLWEFWVIEGLPEGRWAILSKVHHALADGVSATKLQTILFGDKPPARVSQPVAAADPGGMGLLLAAVGTLLINPFEQAGFVVKSLFRPRRLARRVSDIARGLTAMTTALLPVGPSSLTGPIGRDRRYAIAEVSLADVKTAAKAFQVTVNDVLLAAVSGGFRELLLQRGEEPAADSLRTLVPVSVRATGTESTADNQVSLLLPLLPVDVADPVQRLIRVHRRLGSLKAAKEADAGALLTTSAGHEPFAPIAWTIRAAAHLPQRNIVTVTTNIPGPRKHMSVLGREIVAMYPYVPIALRLRTGVAMLSYAGRIYFGITSDAASVPDTTVLAKAIERDVLALCGAAR